MNLVSLILLILASDAAAQRSKNYFFRYIGGNTITHAQRLRHKLSERASPEAQLFYSPGVTAPPHSDHDHFMRIYSNASVPTVQTPTLGAILTVVPTKPHPPPVPGYCGLSVLDGIPDAYRLVYTYRIAEEGPGFMYRAWEFRRSSPTSPLPSLNQTSPQPSPPNGTERGEEGAILLRYAPDPSSEWRWLAVKEKTYDEGMDKWSPWWVKPSAANVAILQKWEYLAVDLELVVATGEVNSGAPGGVDE